MIQPIVLAAGASARLGRPKQLLDFDGTPCLSRVVRACLASSAGQPIVVLGHQADEIARLCDLKGTRIVLNARYESGQTSSIQSGLRALDEHAIAFLLFPVDYALVTASVIDSLIARFKSNPDASAILLPTYRSRHGHPALFGAGYVAKILHLPLNVGADSVVHEHRDKVIEVETDDPWVLHDIDTEQEYRNALAEFNRRKKG